RDEFLQAKGGVQERLLHVALVDRLAGMAEDFEGAHPQRQASADIVDARQAIRGEERCVKGDLKRPEEATELGAPLLPKVAAPPTSKESIEQWLIDQHRPTGRLPELCGRLLRWDLIVGTPHRTVKRLNPAIRPCDEVSEHELIAPAREPLCGGRMLKHSCGRSRSSCNRACVSECPDVLG